VPAEPVPAATVVLLRDGSAGLEVLMLRRSSALAFGGMWVFPGGRVDPGDEDPARPGDSVRTARRAAAREAVEEAGVAVDPDGMVAFSHWVPPPQAPRRFATWFFLAACPEGADVVVDGGEIHEHRWLRPGDAIRRRDAGEIELAPPTWVTLWRLAQAQDRAGAMALASAAEPERFETRVAMFEGHPVALWHGDVGYEDGDPSRPGTRHRLSMLDGGWRYERTTG